MNIAAQLKPTLSASDETCMMIVMRVDKQLFGIPVHHVRDVLREYGVAPIPLAPPEIYGSINLRGRIVTVIDMRVRMKLGSGKDSATHMFVVVEHHGEFYSLMVDSVGEVLTIPRSEIEKYPGNLTSGWREMTTGIHRLPDELLVIIDVQALLAI